MTDWIKNFQLFLFDLDGLLVNTEELHYLAYQRMCRQNGIELTWDFLRYCQAAHYDSTALRDQIYHDFPLLFQKEPNWAVLYASKQQAIKELLEEGAVHLMPGVEKLLTDLKKHNIKRCVVTHSPDTLVGAIRKQHPILNTIPEWLTRHSYTHPKPNPECYLLAIKNLAAKGDSVIGFEDTPRGLTALLETPAKAVLISTINYPEIPAFIQKKASHFSSLEEIPANWNGDR